MVFQVNLAKAGLCRSNLFRYRAKSRRRDLAIGKQAVEFRFLLDQLLAQLPACLLPEGRAAIISFHSLEDRRVKVAFREREIWQKLASKPVTATEDEVRDNPRSRSAKLRVAQLRGVPTTPA
jgi:hypothetical protein